MYLILRVRKRLPVVSRAKHKDYRSDVDTEMCADYLIRSSRCENYISVNLKLHKSVCLVWYNLGLIHYFRTKSYFYEKLPLYFVTFREWNWAPHWFVMYPKRTDIYKQQKSKGYNIIDILIFISQLNFTILHN